MNSATDLEPIFDLKERTFRFAKLVRIFVQKIPRTNASIEDIRQLIRSSGSIAANYVEAQGGLSKKDFVMRNRISRKEALESMLWLRLLEMHLTPDLERARKNLLRECDQLIRIFTAIINKSENR